MPIATADLRFSLSTTAGAAGDTTASSPAGSLGKYISTTELVDATLGNLFDDVTGDENATMNDDYRCLFVKNTHPTLTLQRAVAWLVTEIVGGADAALALDNVGVVPVGQAPAQATTIANPDTPPAAVSAFSTATTKVSGTLIGDIPPGNCAAIWVRRQATNSAAQTNDGATIRVEGDTSA
jgi:hypothetical protein